MPGVRLPGVLVAAGGRGEVRDRAIAAAGREMRLSGKSAREENRPVHLPVIVVIINYPSVPI